MISGLEFPAIGKKREHLSMFHTFLFVDEIPENRKRSSWLDPAMHESKLHNKHFVIKLRVYLLRVIFSLWSRNW
jgi:hypothetical protein